MKKILYLFIASVLLFSCEEGEITFNSSPNDVEISFEAINGGAIMRYELPAKSDIYAIQVDYKGYLNTSLSVKGTYLSDSLVLSGFVDERTDVPVQIRLLNYQDQFSEARTEYISVKISAERGFFDDLEVLSFWDGFYVKYKGPEHSQGIVHVGYIGINPQTLELDTIKIETTTINEGENSILCPNTIDENNMTSAVVWTEDTKGHIIDRKVFKDIVGLQKEKLGADQISMVYAPEQSDEDSELKIGWEYLFNGDTKGVERMTVLNRDHLYCFVSEENVTPDHITIEFDEPQELAMLKMYSPLLIDLPWYNWRIPYVFSIVPSSVKVYGANSLDISDEEWELVGEFYESNEISTIDRWNFRGSYQAELIESLEDLEAAEPCFSTISLKVPERKHKYLKFYVEDVCGGTKSYGSGTVKTKGRFGLQELEIYVVKR